MRRKDESKKPIIADFINALYYEHDKVPSVREIVNGTGMPPFTINPRKNGNFFGSSHFCVSSCRHFVDSLSPLRKTRRGLQCYVV